MIAWLNFAVLVLATVLTVVFYVRSGGSAALEQKIGPAGTGRGKSQRQSGYKSPRELTDNEEGL